VRSEAELRGAAVYLSKPFARSALLAAIESAMHSSARGRRSERRFHELRREPGFPAAVVLGARSVRWLREELVDYARSLPRVDVLDAPIQLQARRVK
jgi:hypothetical protein